MPVTACIMMTMMLLFITTCTAEQCSSYNGDFNGYYPAIATSHHECYLACVTNGSCYGYRYYASTGCQIGVLTTPNDPTETGVFVYVVCEYRYTNTKCASYNNIVENKTVTFDTVYDCFLRCLNDPLCYGYQRTNNECIITYFKGGFVDTNTASLASIGAVRCIPVEPTTTVTTTTSITPTTENSDETTNPAPTTTKKKHCVKG